MIAAAVFGLTLGSEVDVISYLGAQYFGMRNFGALFGTLVMALSMGTAFGPLSAGAVYDAFGSYEPFLKGTVLLMAISSITLYTLRRNKTADEIDP
jgi:MFS family permease